RVEEYTGIPPKDVCVHVTHTHKGAPTEDIPSLGQHYDAAYTDVMVRLAADAVTLAYKRLDTAEGYFALGSGEGLAFNRNYLLADGSAVSFSAGARPTAGMLSTADTDLPLLLFKRGDEPIGAIFSFACHQDSTGDETDGYSSDFSGVVARELKKQYGPDFVTLFLMGAAGDSNHIDPERATPYPPFWHREIGKRLAAELLRIADEATPVGGGVATVKEEITLGLRVANADYVNRQTAAWKTAYAGGMRTRNLLRYAEGEQKTEDTLLLQVIRIGEVGIYAFAGEVYADFGRAVKARAGLPHAIVATNCNSHGGYIPTPAAFAPAYDLYETSLCQGSRHTPEAGGQMVEKLLEMEEKL
ncbi:MAG: hypothetical protein IJ012_07505, partial [Clostridia bacterium]|nr:hypothetical protein [Clostridia bacterium]